MGSLLSSGHSSGADWPVPRWSMKTRSRRLFSRESRCSTRGATWMALWPGPPASISTASGCLLRAIAGTTT
jgi:hypothetical protein